MRFLTNLKKKFTNKFNLTLHARSATQMAKWIREKRSRRFRFDGATPTAAAEQGLRSLAGSPVESIESASDRRESGVSQRERYAPDSVLGFRFPGNRGLVLSSATSSSTSRQPRGQARHAVPPLHAGHVGDPDEQSHASSCAILSVSMMIQVL